jgi:hypothetical protein
MRSKLVFSLNGGDSFAPKGTQMTRVSLTGGVDDCRSFAVRSLLLALLRYCRLIAVVGDLPFSTRVCRWPHARALLLLLLLLWLFALAQEGIYNAGVQMTTGFRSCETGEFYDVISPSETEIDFILLFLSGFMFPT